MGKSVAVYYSSSAESGNTARLLAAFMRGIERGGDSTETFAVKDLNISPCTGEFHCWFKAPGQCHIQDDMQNLYPTLREADTLILATPVFIPLPGEMQNLLNRLCPLIEPELETREGRTRGRMRKDVSISRITLVSSSGWWELENFDTVVRIARELAEDVSVPFAGAVLRPHAAMALGSEKSQEVLDAAEQAGFELATSGSMSSETLALVSQPLVDQEQYREHLNAMTKKAVQ
ncbi:NAD(P)H-dependent oxidoreductase [Candidatus Bipolaricaulota bacterium]|nr:NAD(P)H-dependent oxidoreductase [Candidatus Bipolaricaulota bacterium]